VGGWVAGKLLHHFGEVTHQPDRIWWAVTAVGVATAALLWIYDKAVKAGDQESVATSQESGVSSQQ